MSARRIVIAGAGGFLGRYLARRFREAGDTVSTVGRAGADANWGDRTAIEALLDGSDLLINLAGKSVNCRYTPRNRAAIFSSRLLTTAELGETVQAVAHPPAVWFNASTATIYRHADDRPMGEETGNSGPGSPPTSQPRGSESSSPTIGPGFGRSPFGWRSCSARARRSRGS
ncbi:MAG: NAD-dependent epimerase/dehydratase family protein [Galbitalea sp.]